MTQPDLITRQTTGERLAPKTCIECRYYGERDGAWITGKDAAGITSHTWDSDPQTLCFIEPTPQERRPDDPVCRYTQRRAE